MPSVWTLNRILGRFFTSAALGFAACSGGTPTHGGTTGSAVGQPPPSSPASGMPSGPAAPAPGAVAPGSPAVPGAPTTPAPGTPTAPAPGTVVTPTPGTPTTPANPSTSEGGPANPHWLSYGNGPKNQFYNGAETKISVETAPKLKQLWAVQIGEVTGAPAVVGDRVYVNSNGGLFALNAKDGSQIWTAANIRGTSAAFYDEETKMLFVNGSGGTLFGVDAEMGTVKWSGRLSMQSGTQGWSSAIVSKNLVVAGVGAIDTGTFKGGLAAFDKMTGTKAWEYTHVTTSGASIWSGPGADDDGVIYATSGNNYGQPDNRSDSIFAVMPGTGMATMLWNYQASMGDAWTFSGGTGPDHDFGANPIIVDINGMKLVAAGQKSGEFHLLNRTSGELIAKQRVGMLSNAATGGILNNGAYDGKNNLFIAGANEGLQPGQTVAMEADPSKMLAKVWERKNSGLMWGQISSANGVCFVPDDTTMVVLNCKTGEELAKIMVPGTIGSAAAISEGRAFFGSGFTYGLGPVKTGRTLVAVGLE